MLDVTLHWFKILDLSLAGFDSPVIGYGLKIGFGMSERLDLA